VRQKTRRECAEIARKIRRRTRVVSAAQFPRRIASGGRGDDFRNSFVTGATGFSVVRQAHGWMELEELSLRIIHSGPGNWVVFTGWDVIRIPD
jgi:hypothetical protein